MPLSSPVEAGGRIDASGLDPPDGFGDVLRAEASGEDEGLLDAPPDRGANPMVMRLPPSTDELPNNGGRVAPNNL